MLNDDDDYGCTVQLEKAKKPSSNTGPSFNFWLLSMPLACACAKEVAAQFSLLFLSTWLKSLSQPWICLCLPIYLFDWILPDLLVKKKETIFDVTKLESPVWTDWWRMPKNVCVCEGGGSVDQGQQSG